MLFNGETLKYITTKSVYDTKNKKERRMQKEFCI